MKFIIPNFKVTTFWGIMVLVLVMIAWDFYLIKDSVSGNTISAVFKWMSQFPCVPYICGFLAGHIFWHAPGIYPENHVRYVLIGFGIAFVLMMWGLISEDKLMMWLRKTPIVVFVLMGIPSGRIFWPQYIEVAGK